MAHTQAQYVNTVVFSEVVEATVFVEQGDKGFLVTKLLENTGLEGRGVVMAGYPAALGSLWIFEDILGVTWFLRVELLVSIAGQEVATLENWET